MDEFQPRAKYIVLELGKMPLGYRITELNSVPIEGWTDEYKTRKIVLRRIEPGEYCVGRKQTCVGRKAWNWQSCQTSLTHPYYIGVFEITQRQWELVVGNRPSHYTNDYLTRPVEQVSYADIRGRQLGAKWPLGAKVDPYSFVGLIRAMTGCARFDLPTEVQWEVACRAGTQTSFNNGSNLTNSQADASMDAVGRYAFNGGSDTNRLSTAASGTAKVGEYSPNNWGIYDMHGNVWEWCLDSFATGTTPSGIRDYCGPEIGNRRVLRGGSCNVPAGGCRSAERGCNISTLRSHSVGFRIVLNLAEKGVSRLLRSRLIREDLDRLPETHIPTEADLSVVAKICRNQIVTADDVMLVNDPASRLVAARKYLEKCCSHSDWTGMWNMVLKLAERDGPGFALTAVRPVLQRRQLRTEDAKSFLSRLNEYNVAWKFLTENKKRLESTQATDLFDEALHLNAGFAYCSLGHLGNACVEFACADISSVDLMKMTMRGECSCQNTFGLLPPQPAFSIANFWWEVGLNRGSLCSSFCHALGAKWYKKALDVARYKLPYLQWRSAAEDRLREWTYTSVKSNDKRRFDSPFANKGVRIESVEFPLLQGWPCTKISSFRNLDIAVSKDGGRTQFDTWTSPLGYWLRESDARIMTKSYNGDRIIIVKATRLPLRDEEFVSVFPNLGNLITSYRKQSLTSADNITELLTRYFGCDGKSLEIRQFDDGSKLEKRLVCIMKKTWAVVVFASDGCYLVDFRIPNLKEAFVLKYAKRIRGGLRGMR